MNDNDKTVIINHSLNGEQNNQPINQPTNQPVNQPVQLQSSGGIQFNQQNIPNNQQFNQSYNQQNPEFSMHLSEPPATNNNGKKKSSTPIIITLMSVIVVLLIVVIVLLVSKGKNKDKTTEATTEITTEKDTEATTENSTNDATETTTNETTESTTPNVPATPGYVPPTALGTSWKDYNFSLDGTLYQLPIPYPVFMQYGWTTEDSYETIPAGDFTFVSVTSSLGTDCCIILGNPTVSECPLEQSIVLGITIDTEYDALNSDFILPGNIQVTKSTITDVKAAYGTPDDYTAFDGGSSVTYIGDNIDDGLDMEFNSNEVITQITYLRAEVKDAASAGAANVSQEVPAMNSEYVRPTSGSSAENDGILTIDGAYYKLPVPLSEFLQNGWTLDIMSEEIIYGGNSTFTYISKGNCKLGVTIRNYTSDAIITTNGIVSSVDVDDYATEGMDITFPGGIKIGSDGQTVTNAYSKYDDDYYEDTFGDYTSYGAYMYFNTEDYLEYDAFFSAESGIITSMEYEIYGFSSYSDIK